MRFASTLAACLLAALFALPAASEETGALFGNEEADVINPAKTVSGLIRSGRFKEAMDLADRELASNPRNLNLRFLRGVIFSETGKPEDAKKVFEQLTREFPEVSEPYNNLAAIYAAEGNLSYAKELLEQSLLNNPKAVATLANLGDVYAALAEQNYAKALDLNPGSSALKKKLEAVRSVLTKPE